MKFKGPIEDKADKLAQATSADLKRALRWTLDKQETDTIPWKSEHSKTHWSHVIERPLLSMRNNLLNVLQLNRYSKLPLPIKAEITRDFKRRILIAIEGF